MKNTNLTYKLKGLNHLVIALFLLVSPLTGAYAACCAGHGGVTSCNKSTGHQMCKDGTASPTCTCTIPKTTTKPTTTKPKAIKTPPTTTTTTTKPKSTFWGGKSTTPTPATGSKSNSNSGTSAKGCCSRHGGVAQCDKSSGHQMCKDGTASPSCTCH